MKHTRLFPFIALTALLLFSATCGGSAATTNAVAQPVVPVAVDPKAALESSLKAQLALTSYRGTMVGEFKGETSQTIVEYLTPDRYRVKNDALEAILIGKTTYLKFDGGWTKMDMDLTGMINSFRDPKLIEEGISDVTYVGSQQINGKTTDVYTYRSSVDINGQKFSTDVKIWTGRQDNLPLKMEVRGEVEGEATFSTVTYDYTSSISIEPPM